MVMQTVFLVAKMVGATYLAKVKGRFMVRPAWLCNVTHTVLGEHPKTIYIHSIAA